MVDPTAFARVATPSQAGLSSGLASIIAGEQAGRIEKQEGLADQARQIATSAFDAWRAGDQQGFQNNLRQLSTLDPKAASDLNAMFGGIQKQNLGQAAMRIYAAAASPDMEAKKTLLGQASEFLQGDENNIFAQGLKSMQTMTDPDELDKELFGSVQIAQNLGLLPGAAGGKGGEKQKTEGYLVREGGKTFYVNPVFDKQTGTYAMEKTEMPGEVLTEQGETITERTERQLSEKRRQRTAENALKKQQEMQNRYFTINEGIQTYDEAISILQEGIKDNAFLGVGPIARYLPKLNETANRLNNVFDRMGLNVIQSVTFGALSERELKTAMDTAVPRNLKGEALLKYLEDRKQAQKKLADYFYEASTFIGSEDPETGKINTVSDWMKIQKQIGKNRQSQSVQPEQAQQPQMQVFKQADVADLPNFTSVEQGEQAGVPRFIAPGPDGRPTVYEAE